MHTRLKRFAVGFLAAAVLGGCSELDVSNPNAPDLERALGSGEDVRNIAISSVNSWYLDQTDIEPWLMQSVTADMGTSNFGNFGMRFNNLEPRAEYVNNSAGGDRGVTENPWNGMYGTLGQANDVLRAIAGGIKVEDDDAETAKYQALAQWSQVASLSGLALEFDQAFIVDETTDAVANPPVLQPYTEVAADALTRWDALIASLNGKSEVYDVTVFPMESGTLTSERLQRIANTMAARLLAYTPRTSAENAAVDWAKVVSYASKGISGAGGFDVSPVGDGCNVWCSLLLFYGNEPTWTRVDMRLINLMDPNSPSKFTGTIPPEGSSPDARFASDFQFHGAVIGDPARGIYMQSPYSHKRWRYHARTVATSGEGPAPLFLKAENDLLWAEGLIRTNGDLAQAAQLINNSRVTRGQLAPATAGDGATELLNKLYYERQVELFNTSGVELYDARRTDRLEPGTVRHLPVPAKELEVLALPIYTFGGVGKPDMNVTPNLNILGAIQKQSRLQRRIAQTATPN
jgi:hypothetical protein